jgi:hypothetical protein
MSDGKDGRFCWDRIDRTPAPGCRDIVVVVTAGGSLVAGSLMVHQKLLESRCAKLKVAASAAT